MKPFRNLITRSAVVIVLVFTLGAPAVGSQPSPATTEVPRLAERLMGQTTPTQRSALADLKVSRQEYEQAVERTIDCLRGRGFRIRGPLASDDGQIISYEFTVNEMTPAISGSIDDAQNHCAGEYLDEVELLYWQQLVPRGERRVAMQRQLAECLTAATNQRIDENIHPEDVINLVVGADSPAAWDCRERYDVVLSEPVDF